MINCERPGSRRESFLSGSTPPDRGFLSAAHLQRRLARREFMTTSASNNSFLFNLNGRSIAIDDCSVHTTLLDRLRERGLTGAKEGCAEGSAAIAKHSPRS
jgi:hypothetical protein